MRESQTCRAVRDLQTVESMRCRSFKYHRGECLNQHKSPSNHSWDGAGAGSASELFRSTSSHPFSARYPSSTKCSHTLCNSVLQSWFLDGTMPISLPPEGPILPSGMPRANHTPFPCGSSTHDGELWHLSWCSLFQTKLFRVLQLFVIHPYFHSFHHPYYSEYTWLCQLFP